MTNDATKQQSLDQRLEARLEEIERRKVELLQRLVDVKEKNIDNSSTRSSKETKD